MTPGPRVDLSIEEAVARAREKNIDIAVARITPRLTDFSIAALDANYRVNLTSTTNNQRSTRAAGEPTQGITAPTTVTTRAWSAGFAQNLWKGGGNYNVELDQHPRRHRRARTTSATRSFNSSLAVNFTQPLLRGFRIDATRASLQTSRISQQNDEIALQSTMTDDRWPTRATRTGTSVFAIQAVEAAQNSLDISQQARAGQPGAGRNRHAGADRHQVGAKRKQANRRLTLVQAQATVRTVRAGAQATDRQRHRRSAVGLVDQPGRPSGRNARADQRRCRGCSARCSERTDMQQSLNNLKVSDINLRTRSIRPGRS